MRRGTTPTHKFNTDIDLTGASVIFITYKQANGIALEKTGDEITATEDSLTVELSQEDTLAFKTFGTVRMQIRAKFPDGTAVASNIIERPAEEILKDGEI